MPAPEQFVFGYGSLASAASGLPARLQGHRRVWGVAMDNRVTIPGYKMYRLRADGSRPAVFVAFLDIVPDPEAATDGILVAVDDRTLRGLDARERNYVRADVTAALSGARGTVWAYVGSSAGRDRLRRGMTSGTAVVDRGYLDRVRAGYAELGIDDDPGCGGLPVADLARIDLPPSPARGYSA